MPLRLMGNPDFLARFLTEIIGLDINLRCECYARTSSWIVLLNHEDTSIVQQQSVPQCVRYLQMPTRRLHPLSTLRLIVATWARRLRQKLSQSQGNTKWL